MKKGNLFSGLFFSPKKTIEKIQPQLKALEVEIKAIEAMDNKVEAIIKLFQVISPIQDTGGFSQEIFQLEKNANQNNDFAVKIKALKILQKHFDNAGRSEFGMNRTKKYEEVTANKVFLGDVFGLWTKPADYWLNKKSELEKTLRPEISRDPENPVSNWYIINNYQAGEFVKSHTHGILEQIKVLKAT